MARIKSITVSVKKSWRYQSFECTEVVDLEQGDNATEVKQIAMARCRKAVVEQIDIEKSIMKHIEVK